MTKDYNYNWKRFWCPREGTFNLSDEGFLNDPDHKYGIFNNPDVVPFSSISEIPCLILLGESGIGKTSSIEEEVFSEKEKIEKNHDFFLSINLNGYEDIKSLKDDLFDNQKFINWKNSDKKLFLFLDSFDECLLRIDTVTKLMEDLLLRTILKQMCKKMALIKVMFQYLVSVTWKQLFLKLIL